MKNFKKTSEYSIFWARIPVNSELEIFLFCRCFLNKHLRFFCIYSKGLFSGSNKKIRSAWIQKYCRRNRISWSKISAKVWFEGQKVVDTNNYCPVVKQWAYNHVLVTVVCLILLASILPNLKPCHSIHALPLKIHYNHKVYT